MVTLLWLTAWMLLKDGPERSVSSPTSAAGTGESRAARESWDWAEQNITEARRNRKQLLVLFCFCFLTPDGSNTLLLLSSLLGTDFCLFLLSYIILSVPVYHNLWLAWLVSVDDALRARNSCFGFAEWNTSLVVFLQPFHWGEGILLPSTSTTITKKGRP